ncbi:hypothetical protein J4421_01290 [Candidatus Woesearchaeota archaeon]|nr:hypothetical protein [Candidatus Woesearchaeota archaeon]
MEIITEHFSKINVTLPEKDVHRKMEVFYNPLMKSQRNITLLLLNSIEKKHLNIADPLAGSGVRSLRFLRELKKEKVQNLFVNDIKDNFSAVFENNLKSNSLKKTEALHISQEEANLFLLNQINPNKDIPNFCGYFDYIDIDPFGSPNPFINAAIARINRGGIMAITATDTAALTGTYPKVTQRKYWATPLKNYMMHEIGLRILIRKIQLMGVQFDKALIPILSYHKDHYFRIFFQSIKGKKKSDEIISQHQFLLWNPITLECKTSSQNSESGFKVAGPLWIGKLFDHKLLAIMVKQNPFPEEKFFLTLLHEEAKHDTVGFYDLHEISRLCKCDSPKIDFVAKKLQGSRTHFSLTGIKTTKKIMDIKKIFICF